MIAITVAYATPKKQVEIPLTVENSCTIALAIERSGIRKLFPEISMADISVGLNSRLADLDTLMESGDRLEIYRPLIIDPKEARRNRLKKKN